MGKRKKSSRTPQGPRKNDPLPTVFSCLFCNHEKSVSIKIDKKSGVGELECKVCGQRFQCGVNYLSAPIDVYSEWVDAADAVANEGGGLGSRASGSARASGRGAGMSYRRDEEEDDRRYEGEGIVGDDEVEYE